MEEALKNKHYRASEWIDPRVEIRRSPIADSGMFARAAINEGETVVVWGGGTVFTKADIEAGKVDDDSTVPIGEGVYLGSPMGTYNRDEDLSDFMNHACDPNVWMTDEVTLTARRPIQPGEELTADYTLWKDDEQSVVAWECCCGSPLCRHRITGKDWQLPELQQRYDGHFSPFLNERIQKLNGTEHCRKTAGS